MTDYVRVVNLSHRFGKEQVLHEIDTEIKQGEIFGLLGPSGAGKTTLVKMIVGILAPTEGQVLVNNEKMPTLTLMKKIGYMAQSDALYMELTARENLEFFAGIYGLSNSKRKKRLKEVMEIVGLIQHIDKPVHQYSGGMKRRLSLAIALLHHPPLLILDEPTVGIDPVLRQSIWEELYKMKERGATIVVTTHVMDEAEKCDRLGLIREGRLIAVGTPKELKERTNATTMEEAFLSYGGDNA